MQCVVLPDPKSTAHNHKVRANTCYFKKKKSIMKEMYPTLYGRTNDSAAETFMFLSKLFNLLVLLSADDMDMKLKEWGKFPR